jgi:post-segregation antitoxin (ccd killing protein)
MRHNRKVALFLSVMVAAARLFAEDQPEIAYRILSSYVDKQEAEGDRGLKIGGLISYGIGGSLAAASATTWLAGDRISRAASGHSLDPDTKLGLTLGLGIGSAVMLGVGTGLSLSHAPDYRVEYAEVFKEKDAQIREALAVAVLHDLSTKGKKERISGAVSSLLVPVLSAAITAGMNVSDGKPWQDGVLNSAGWSAWSIAGAVSQFFSLSKEERLYDKYLAGRDALYGSTSREP